MTHQGQDIAGGDEIEALRKVTTDLLTSIQSQLETARMEADVNRQKNLLNKVAVLQGHGLLATVEYWRSVQRFGQLSPDVFQKLDKQLVLALSEYAMMMSHGGRPDQTSSAARTILALGWQPPQALGRLFLTGLVNDGFGLAEAIDWVKDHGFELNLELMALLLKSVSEDSNPDSMNVDKRTYRFVCGTVKRLSRDEPEGDTKIQAVLHILATFIKYRGPVRAYATALRFLSKIDWPNTTILAQNTGSDILKLLIKKLSDSGDSAKAGALARVLARVTTDIHYNYSVISEFAPDALPAEHRYASGAQVKQLPVFGSELPKFTKAGLAAIESSSVNFHDAGVGSQVPSPPVDILSVCNARLALRREAIEVLNFDGECLREMSNALGRRKSLSRPTAPQVDVQKAYFIGDNFSYNNYCHLIVDWLPRCLLLERNLGWDARIVGPKIARNFVGNVFKAFGIDPARLLELEANQRANVGQLAMLSTSVRGVQHPMLHGRREVVEFMRDAVRGHMSSGNFERVKLHLSRATAGGRKVLQEQELAERLEAMGFLSIDPGQLTVEEQINLFSRAEVVVAPHGAALTNVLFCPPNARVVELFPPEYGTLVYFRLAESVGLSYVPVVGQPLSVPGEHLTNSMKNRLNVSVNVDDVLRAVTA